jgi:type 1 glutamine amidotransferase
MKYLNSIFFLFAVIICLSCDKDPAKQDRVLVFAKTSGFRHSSIPQGKAAIQQLGRQNGFTVDTTEDAALFTGNELKKYMAVIFLNTTGDVLNDQQQLAFEEYIRAGGGYAGVHAASDTEYDWPWYGKLAGAYFMSHPEQQEATLQVKDHQHASTRHLPAVWERKDEWYNFKDLNPAVKVLITIDEQSYTGGKNGDPHPMCWYHEYDGGRAWYTALGHTEASYSEDNFLKHLLGGIQYAMGKAGNR